MPAIIKKNVVYGGGGSRDSSKTISYADYLNLPEAEKTKGIVYYVPDYPEDNTGNVKEVYTGTATVSATSGKAVFTHNLNIEGTYTIDVICTSNENLVHPYSPTANSVKLMLTDTSFGFITGERTISYTISKEKAVSVSGSEWTLLGSVSGNNILPIDISDYKELSVIVEYNNSLRFTSEIPVSAISDTPMLYNIGGYYSFISGAGTASSTHVNVQISKNQITLAQAHINNVNSVDKCVTYVYARKNDIIAGGSTNNSETETEFAEITKITNSYADIATEASYVCLKNGICYLCFQIVFSTLYSGWVDVGKLPIIPDTNGIQVYDTALSTGDAKNPTATWFRVMPDGTIKIIPNGTQNVVFVANVSFPYKNIE